MDLSTILSEIRAMSIEDRIRLVQAVWDDIAAEQPTIELSDSFKAELDRRLRLMSWTHREPFPGKKFRRRPSDG